MHFITPVILVDDLHFKRKFLSLERVQWRTKEKQMRRWIDLIVIWKIPEISLQNKIVVIMVKKVFCVHFFISEFIIKVLYVKREINLLEPEDPDIALASLHRFCRSPNTLWTAEWICRLTKKIKLFCVYNTKTFCVINYLFGRFILCKI